MAKKGKSKKRPPQTKRYSADFTLRAVKLHLEEEYPTPVVAGELGIGQSTLGHRIKRYREQVGAAVKSQGGGAETQAPRARQPPDLAGASACVPAAGQSRDGAQHVEG